MWKIQSHGVREKNSHGIRPLRGYVISERILWFGLLKHSLSPVDRLTPALIIFAQDTVISKEKKGSTLLSVFFYTRIWERIRKGDLEGFGEEDLDCELFRSKMASHGRGRGVRRNFETGKETKVSFSSQKSRLKSGNCHLFGLRDCFSSLQRAGWSSWERRRRGGSTSPRRRGGGRSKCSGRVQRCLGRLAHSGRFCHPWSHGPCWPSGGRKQENDEQVQNSTGGRIEII